MNARHHLIRRNRAGFTLVEMGIVVLIVGILAAVAIPALRSNSIHTLESISRVVAADLRLARTQAMHSGSDWAVQLDTANNAYQVVHTGTGTPVPLKNPLAAPGSSSVYRIELDRLGMTGRKNHSVRLAGAALKESKAAVTDVTFKALGGTGPTRVEDTVLWLTEGSGSNVWYVRLTVSWVTGQVWIDAPQKLDPTNPGQMFD